MKETLYLAENEEETKNLGLQFAEHLKPGFVIGLIGDLGAGKTTFAKAVAEGLGIEDTVTSPTFTIIKEYYDGRLPFYHFDVYRLKSTEEIINLGCEEYFYGEGVTVIEWADKILDLLPEDAIIVEFKSTDNKDERLIMIKGIKL
ncbi:MAG: tRNA (adenosine(37)-N6)-threonylcarbamoyltransferase complex ATPase subunit type 1 TsaE [Anaerovoracaceae bacterium]|nr:tRNA (adenosine(37)-N6)-threonylcarbamoyltransferase complex ATPase subunit type 1 TsaE [Clostridiales bacterium]